MTFIEVVPGLTIELYAAGDIDRGPALALRSAEGGCVVVRSAVAATLVGALAEAAGRLAEQAVQAEAPRCQRCRHPLPDDDEAALCPACFLITAFEAEAVAANEVVATQAPNDDAAPDPGPVYEVPGGLDDSGIVVRLSPPRQCVGCGELAVVGLVSLQGDKVLPVCGRCGAAVVGAGR